MEPTNSAYWRNRARAFLTGEYPGAPVAYLMALAIVFAMISVILAGLVQELLAPIAALLTLLGSLLLM
jgi:hypothetical protein